MDISATIKNKIRPLIKEGIELKPFIYTIEILFYLYSISYFSNWSTINKFPTRKQCVRLQLNKVMFLINKKIRNV